ncbi:thiamine-phosphate kinase [Magnetospirillum molischianum]|uniref:Thiamine-monophosphate kinase n=1 Tax=Magnetospirillum molischianum DSM 120 TaxID=1150626 RepID=H8FUV3_MAGML|nr:thiamine-phosphate kinase [Magnetospirillum molischianum]CCG42141.1 thiamin-monophosphate kinase [Magnetospirillum molischianum DSM 120]
MSPVPSDSVGSGSGHLAEPEAVDEFALIADLFVPLTGGHPAARGLADDAAFLVAEPGTETVLTVDAMVAGVHFLPDDPPDLIARKLIRVNLSDLAAKGAEPVALLLAAAFPHDVTADWLRAFAEGLRQDLTTYDTVLIGGDTVATPGPLTLSLTAIGRVAAGQGLPRSGASVGDDIWVSGTIGDGSLGLRAARGELNGLSAADVAFLADRYRLPRPRIELGPRLIGLAGASMDVSDGLIQDLGHLCRASGVGARIEMALVPLSDSASRAVDFGLVTLASLLSGGDDYEVLFTASPRFAEAVAALGGSLGLPLTRIGAIVAHADAVTVIDPAGSPLVPVEGGWRHFRAGQRRDV